MQDFKTYRRFGGNANLGGSYVSTIEKLSREELALVKEFNNSMRFEAIIKIPKGSDAFIIKLVNAGFSNRFLRTGSPIGSLDFQSFYFNLVKVRNKNLIYSLFEIDINIHDFVWGVICK